MSIRDFAITEGLSKLELTVGQEITWIPSYKVIVVGYDKDRKHIIVQQSSGQSRIPDLCYTKKENAVHSRFDFLQDTYFALMYIDTQSSTEDKKIEKNLKELGLSPGEEVFFSNNGSRINTDRFVEGDTLEKTKVIGNASNGMLIVEHPRGWDVGKNDNKQIHSSQHSLCGKRALYFQKGAVKKTRDLKTAKDNLDVALKEFIAFPISVKTEEATILAKKSEVSPMRKELKEAGYRVAATQTINASRAAIISLLSKTAGENDKVQAINSLLSSEYGKAMIAMMLGLGLPQIKVFETDPRLAKLAQECRIGGMTIAGNELIETIFRSALETLTATPPVVRVASPEERIVEEDMIGDILFEEETEEEEEEEKKKMAL
jgi:hypothetical protein